MLASVLPHDPFDKGVCVLFSSVSFLQTLCFGALTGATIFLGLPLARLKVIGRSGMAFLNAIAIGILFFLFVDVVKEAVEPVLEAVRGHQMIAVGLSVLLVGGFVLGLMSLALYGKLYLGRDRPADHQSLALLIAISIGLHNAAEGLAIGTASHGGKFLLTLLLIIGFGLHNLTEAFGIIAPLAGKSVRVRTLLLLGLIGGGPTTIGTVVGYLWSSPLLSLFFLALAAGAILYVIGELLAAGRKLESELWTSGGLAVGFILGLATEMVLVSMGG